MRRALRQHRPRERCAVQTYSEPGTADTTNRSIQIIRIGIFAQTDHDEYEVYYQFDIGSRPLFLFGVKDNDKARLATISCLEFQRRRIPSRITSASDKQFPSFDDFRENGPQFFERERAA
jgi:hypothetical protein